MDAFLVTIVGGGRAILTNMGSSKQKFISSLSLFYCFIKNQAQALLFNSFRRGSLCGIGRIHISHAVGAANISTIVVMFVGLVVLGSTVLSVLFLP